MHKYRVWTVWAEGPESEVCYWWFPMVFKTTYWFSYQVCWRGLRVRRMTGNMFKTWTGYWVLENVELRMICVRCQAAGNRSNDDLWWNHLFVVGVRTRNRHRKIFVGSVAAVHSLPKPAEPWCKALTDFWLDALHESLATAGWMEGKGGEEQ